MLWVGIRYCGGCNPQIDRTGLVEKLKEETKKRLLDVAFTTDRDRVTDITLFVNGCIHGCLEEDFLRTGNQGPYLSVKGETVGDNYIAEKEIPAFLVQEMIRQLPLFD